MASNGRKLSVERIYQKKTQREHILLRPDSYIGSALPVTERMYVIDENERIVNKEITYVPGLYKIFDEILVNAADNKQRDSKMDTIKVDIDPQKNEIKVYNNGRGIPVVHHKTENMFVPTMIFGHLLTSSNFDDEEEKVTGGRNGYGAKLANVFSTRFVVETACKESKKEFKQVWANNMTEASEPKIKDFSGEDFTRVTFRPDLPRFKMETLDKDTVSLLSRRAYDIAASAKGVKVFLNGKRIAIKGFKDYVEFFLKGQEDDLGNPIKAVYEACSPRWEVAVTVSEKGFQQMSFVNSIATTKGGRHVDYVADMVTKALLETIKKKNKGGIDIKPFQIKNHLWVFVNCLIVNPTFDSQTKENMTLQIKSFGSKCSLSDKFIGQINKSGIVEAVLAWSKFKQDQQLKSKASGRKTNKIKGIPKLEDANDAGSRNSMECTLILTEGDSAKTLAVSGLSIVGRDKYGVYPLRGKLLNVREATHKQLLENKEINELVKIIGLTYKKKYESVDDMKSLRYGKMMIMTDQDQDGSHIKGLLINFIHHNWPSLLRLSFLEEFITPIVKVTKGNHVQSFYSLPEFSEWKNATENWCTYKIKYYKGLGTSTSKEAKEYFQDMKRHRILFKYQGPLDDHAINMAFSKKAIEERKTWLTNWMEEGKRRRELGLSEEYLYEKNTKAVSYSDFINKELVLYSNLDNERSIPSVVDGFKPGQRKVMFTCLKRNDKREVKVAQLAGSVGEMSAYHHGEASLMGTIINLAQNFVGSNNINLLQPIGQFGTRLTGGKDHASPRYIFTQLSPLARHIFNVNDDNVLTYLKDDNLKVEPQYYVPILPMVLVNGADGIGTGWMTKIPNFNPRDIVRNIRRMLKGEEPKEMIPWFKDFRGTIVNLGDQRYVINGEVAKLSDTKLEITELPVRTWTQAYKESTMELMLNGNEKLPGGQITDYKEYHTDVTVKFIVQMTPEKLQEAETKKGLHQFFKLQTTMSTSSMVLFDAQGCLRRYESPIEIIREFFDIRLDYYDKRKKFLVGMLEAESLKLTNQARFILEKCDGSLVIENKKRKLMIAELQRRGFDSDPVKKWKKSQQEEKEDELEAEDEEEGEEESEEGPDYDYLLGMAMWSLTQERKDDLLKKKDEKLQELKIIKSTSKEQMWMNDLDEFIKKLDEIEIKERAEIDKIMKGDKGALKGNHKKGSLMALKKEALPSAHAIRIKPLIADELRTKVAKAAAAKDRKGAKKVPTLIKEEEEKDEFDFMIESKEHNKSLSERIGVEVKDDIVAKKKPSTSSSSPSKKNKKGGKKGNPWDSDISDASSDEDIELDNESFERKERAKRAAAAKKKSYKFDDESESSGSDVELFHHEPEAESAAAVPSTTFTVSDTDSEFGNDESPSSSSSPIKKPAQKRSTTTKKQVFAAAVADSDSDDDDDTSSPEKKQKLDDSSNEVDAFDALTTTTSNGNFGEKKSFGGGGGEGDSFIVSSEDDNDFGKLTKMKKNGDAGAKKKQASSKPSSKVSKKKKKEEDEDEPLKKKKAQKAKKPAAAAAAQKSIKKKKTAFDSDSENGLKSSGGSDFEMSEDIAPVRVERPGRAKKTISYNFDDEEESD